MGKEEYLGKGTHRKPHRPSWRADGDYGASAPGGLGDPDTFSELKEKLERDFNPELIPETPEEVENFATNFVSWIIDTYHYLKQEWLADENLIEEIKKVTVERMSSWSRCPQALAPKLWEGWRIQALSPVDLGIEFDIGSYGKLALFAIHENGPVFDAEVFDGENPSKKIGDLRDIYEKIFWMGPDGRWSLESAERISGMQVVDLQWGRCE